MKKAARPPRLVGKRLRAFFEFYQQLQQAMEPSKRSFVPVLRTQTKHLPATLLYTNALLVHAHFDMEQGILQGSIGPIIT
jgi:hypothetical protein